MKMLFEMDSHDYDISHGFRLRPSARAIIIQGGKVAMIHGRRRGFYKLPGGGVEPGETVSDAMRRETLEECGLIVIPESVREFGQVRRRKRDGRGGCVLQDNYYYLCDAQDEAVSPRYTKKEMAEDFIPCFVTPEEAIRANSRPDLDMRFSGMVERENAILRLVRQEIDSRNRTSETLKRIGSRSERLQYYQLMLEGDPRGRMPLALPKGYRFEMYRPGGMADWIDIELSAGEIESRAQGEAVFEKYFAPRESILPDRMVFIADPEGRKVATATALFDIRKPDDGENAMLHWVAVRREHQGRGLSKPLIVKVMSIFEKLGYARAVIPTQTTTWLAVKTYLDLGFSPIPQNAVNSLRGWRIIRAITLHPALSGFDEAEGGEIFTED